MAVFREYLKFTDDLMRARVSIWNDSADYGVPTRQGDINWSKVKTLIALYGDEATRKVSSTGEVSIIINGINEFSDGSEISHKITYFKYSQRHQQSLINKDADGFFTICKTK